MFNPNPSWSRINGSSNFLTKVLVLFVAGCVSNFTLEDALGCVSTLPTAGGSAAIHMVLAGGDSVGPTSCRHTDSVRTVDTTHTCTTAGLSHTKLTNVGVIKASRDQSLFGPEVPGSWRVATITSKKQEKKIKIFLPLQTTTMHPLPPAPQWNWNIWRQESNETFHALLPLTPCHSSHSRSADPLRRSPRWP